MSRSTKKGPFVDAKLFKKVQEMTNGKNEVQLKELASNIAKERGIDLNNFASQFGIKL